MSNGQILRQSTEVPATIAGVADTQLLLLDGIEAVDVGIWMPWSPFRKGSFEVTSIGSMIGTVALKASNAKQMPANGFVATIGGTPGAGDKVGIQVSCGDLLNGGFAVQHTVLLADDADAIAAALATLLVDAFTDLAQQPINSEQVNDAAAFFQVGVSGAAITIKWQTVLAPVSITGGSDGDETVTVTQYDSGEGFTVPNCSLTQPGNVTFDQPAAWIKAAASVYTSGALTAIVVGVIP